MKGQHQKGAAAVEFAFILPVLVLMLFGIVELSLLMYNKQIITNASREGARYGIIAGHDNARIIDVVDEYSKDNLITFGAAEGPGVIVTRSGSLFGDDLTVKVTYNYDFLVLASFGFDTVTLTAKTVMKLE